MKIIVLVKQVPDTETKVQVKPGEKAISTDGVTFVINPYDEYAIEEALRIKEAKGGDVTLISAGWDKAAEALRTGLAMGADKAVHLNDPAFLGGDAHSTAVALAKAIKKMEYDLILCGKQAIDYDNHQVGVRVAELLGIPHVAVVTKLELQDGKAVAHREVEGGSEIVETPLPAVITAQKGLNEPRYASLKGIMQAKKKPLEAKKPADVDAAPNEVGQAGAKTTVLTMTMPPERAAGRVVEGEPEDAAKQVVKLLREEAKVI
ncbi:MAG: electron transfer flavoprotein beta subunit/FixA family protein [Candidatus Abyssobacteria bacterium SURF_17]|uniref:Electron transfer flavoprotein subunit beta n=1 Tax=Candidatus Abyssobacteria bacterium SURF_17 TaxID=2093361 RepID=A0A419EPX7_9BACT|nr:MAG: electron transfer flavoprotein beta subunit/FixA family protein [Candidatus Abyssubacteria bacterium SURF_17]